MRIISGIRRGMRLLDFDHPSVRPTADKVKGSMFNMIMNEADISRCRVLDLFSGTGNLGIEALSRGATHGTFVEQDRRAIELLRKNIQKANFNSISDISQQDALQYLSHRPVQPFELIFADPPYESYLGSIITGMIIRNSYLSSGGLLIIESSTNETIQDLGAEDQLEKIRERTFRDTKITVFKKTP